MVKVLSRKASAARDAANDKKRATRSARSKMMNDMGKAVGLQRSGSSKSTGKASYNAKTKKWSVK